MYSSSLKTVRVPFSIDVVLVDTSGAWIEFLVFVTTVLDGDAGAMAMQNLIRLRWVDYSELSPKNRTFIASIRYGLTDIRTIMCKKTQYCLNFVQRFSFTQHERVYRHIKNRSVS